MNLLLPPSQTHIAPLIEALPRLISFGEAFLNTEGVYPEAMGLLPSPDLSMSVSLNESMRSLGRNQVALCSGQSTTEANC